MPASSRPLNLARIAALYQSGHTMREIAQLEGLGTDHSRISRALTRLGVKSRGYGKTDAHKAKIRAGVRAQAEKRRAEG